MFKNKTVVLVGLSFLNVIDESYMEFVDDKEGFQFPSEEICNLIIEEDIKCIMALLCIKGKCWVVMLIHLEQKAVCVWDCASTFYQKNLTKNMLVPTLLLYHTLFGTSSEKRTWMSLHSVLES